MGAIIPILILALGIFQLAAFQAGLADWLGFHWIISILIGALALMFGGPLGGLAIAVIGFFGAMEAWNWEWWQAGLLCFPSLVLAMASVVINGSISLGSTLLSRRQGHQ